MSEVTKLIEDWRQRHDGTVFVMILRAMPEGEAYTALTLLSDDWDMEPAKLLGPAVVLKLKEMEDRRTLDHDNLST